MRWSPIVLIRTIGLLLCVVSVLLTLVHPTSGSHADSTTLLGAMVPGVTSRTEELFSLVTPVLIGVMLWHCTREEACVTPSAGIIILLAVQTALCLLCSEELEFIVAVEAGLLLSPRLGAIWVLTQALASWLSALLFPNLMSWLLPASDPLKRSIGIGLFMLVAVLYNLFAFGLGWLAAAEKRQSIALALANAELRRVHHANAQSARLNERLTIARELHDAIGHQLTALSINLQVACHLPEGAIREPVSEAYAMTRELLREVRSVVTSMREPVDLDFSSALAAFVLRLANPEVHLNLAPLPKGVQQEFSHALLRCAQEIITNSAKHADAANVWINTRVSDGAFHLHAEDDGVGAATLRLGNGLRGIRERVEELNGTVTFDTAPNRGFRVKIQIPEGQTS